MEIEVDVKLFIKCRMCLDEDGVYQIVPSIKTLIKDCFDIDTDPFDGLPQLICKKCKSILSDYHAVKTTYKLKQQKLQERLVKINQNSTSVKSETGGCNEIVQNGELPTSPATLVSTDANIAPAISTEPQASDKVGAPVKPEMQTSLEHCNKVNNDINDTWKKTYNEYYVCKICDKRFQRYSSIKRHINTHKKTIKMHKKVFKKYCTVQLIKIDKKHYCTSNSNVVVLNTNKIINSKDNNRYHVLYLKKGYSDKQATTENGKVSDKRPGALLETSDEEIVKPKKRKTRRLYSGSSTKTTILEHPSNDKTEPEVKEVKSGVNTNSINENEPSSKKKHPGNTIHLSEGEEAKANIANYKAIQDIVTMCQKKYIKKALSKNESKPPVSETTLKHKVLSLGRKVINKKGFECTGLLRYMEHKNLDISWQPALPSNKKKNSNYVRIMTKLKSREDLDNDDSSWKDLYKIAFDSPEADCKDKNTDSTDTVTHKAEDNEKTSIQPEVKNVEDQIDQILTNNSDDSNSRNKLLNKSPVANPKQLPKKPVSEMKPIITTTCDIATPTIESVQTVNADESEKNFCMPIITSTCSLSTVVEKEKQTDPVIEKPAPRIKVKPPSELMSQKALSNQSNSRDIWAFNTMHASLPYHLSNTTVYTSAPICQSQPELTVITSNIPTDKPNFGDDTSLEYVTLHCLEFPNEKTKFPFQYFKRVLLCHGFELLDINETLPAHYKCLVTFKLLLKQNTIRPLGVWLSLFCSENRFSFAFKDTFDKKFDPNQLPAFWQWELLKIYKGDVVTKILQNASKVSKETHSYTKNFLCLLKSIKCISEP